jgi:hypothetical protein
VIAARASALACAFAAAAAFAQDPAARLESHVERIAKLHAQVGQKVLADRSKRALAETVREFEATLKAATSRATSPEARESFLLLALVARDYRAWALKPATRDTALKLEERREEAAWIAARAARLELPPGSRTGSGRNALEALAAATAAQRLARLYLAQRWGIPGASYEAERSLAVAQLRGALERLRASAYNTPRIDTELGVAEGQLGFLLQAARELESGRGAMQQLEFIAKASDHILESLERAARLYEGFPP